MCSLRLVAILAAAGSAACGDARPVDTRSVVLVTLDTTRCDALEAFGGTRGVTPELDALARESLRYVQARTVAPLTLPAHASMLTGLYPPGHTVRGNGPEMLPGAALTVAEIAAAQGFQTAAFVGGLSLDRAYGIAQGFEAWTQPQAASEREQGQVSDRPGSEVVRDARAWLASRERTRPFFLWVHVFDPHAPYAPEPRFLEQASGHTYYGEVAAMDAALGELFDDLRRERVLESSLVLVVADHGEALREHGEDTHGLQVWDSTLRVPFFVRYPDGYRAGEASDEVVSVVDVAPTVLEALELDVPSDLDGLSLLRRRVPRARGTYFESLEGWTRFRWSPLVGWIDAEAKYVHSSSPQLFDPRSDPGEADDRFATGPEPARYVEAMAAVLRRGARFEADLAPSDAGTAAAIADLGYGSVRELAPRHPDPLAPDDLPPPCERVDEYSRFLEAQSLAREGRHAEASALLEGIVTGNPRSPEALEALSASLIALERWGDAIEVLKRRAALPPDRMLVHQRFAQCYRALGDAPQARRHVLRAMELLIELHTRRGETAEAERLRALYAAEIATGVR